ncbi:MAG: ABC transporter ATP-binding protein [Rhizobiaceae bacterium]|nr:ABC transporter ATP-binding protein [Rhizobiaceae bacterium]
MRVHIRDARKKFGGGGGHLALADISLVAEHGELLVLLGPSGSGKTTLLRSIAGLESLDSGDILFDDKRVNDAEPAHRSVGMVFQDYALYPHLSVHDNIAYNMRIRKIPRAEIEKRVRAAAAMLGIEPYLDRKPAALSGGQRQRVAVARAITRDAHVLLMDEPLSNLDAQIREHVRVELRELQQRLGVTTIYVTHDQVEAMVMADRIAVMNEGRVEQLGEPEEIYDRPATLFCARFVGSPKINEFGGDLIQQDAVTRFRFGGAGTTIEVKGADLKQDGSRKVVFAFRAEDVDFVPDGIECGVSLIENRGAEKFVVATLDPALKGAQISADIRVRIAERDVKGPIRFLPRTAHLFDASSGARIATVQCGRVVASGEGKRAATVERPIARRTSKH